jgi:hypothetical protein
MLDKLNISNSMYSISGERDFDRIILEWGLKWRIYYIDERGGENEIAKFETEGEACEYFYSMMVKFKNTMNDSDKQSPIELPKEEKRIFIVSDNGNIDMQKDD